MLVAVDEYLAVKKGNILFNILLLINPAVYLVDKIYVGRVIVATVPEVCQKCDFP